MTAETAEALAEVKTLIEAGFSPWVSRAGAAAYAHVSVGTIDNLVGEGSLPVAGSIKGLPRFRKRDLDALIESERLKGKRVRAKVNEGDMAIMVGVKPAAWPAGLARGREGA